MFQDETVYVWSVNHSLILTDAETATRLFCLAHYVCKKLYGMSNDHAVRIVLSVIKNNINRGFQRKCYRSYYSCPYVFRL
ncbi:MAG: Uncharacterised protein [Hyphomonas sp. TMED17]|nr:MAG: Uncharacterised protein [Hyphomonas sp. TMED17]